jgi:hypothetical protein
VRGLLSAMSRLECVRQTIRLLLEALEADDRLPAAWACYWDCYVEKKIDPRAAAALLEEKSAQSVGLQTKDIS